VELYLHAPYGRVLTYIVIMHKDNFSLISTSELLGFWNLSIVRILKTRKHAISEKGSVSVLRRRGEESYSVGSLRANLKVRALV
jgi:hypothetical protein